MDYSYDRRSFLFSSNPSQTNENIQTAFLDDYKRPVFLFIAVPSSVSNDIKIAHHSLPRITFFGNVRNCLIKIPVSLYSIYYFSFKFLCFLKLSSLLYWQLSKVSLSGVTTSWPNVLAGHARHQYCIWPMSSYDNCRYINTINVSQILTTTSSTSTWVS